MSGLLLVSYIALWVLVVLLALGFAALARQIGFLHHRIAPVGARMINAGPEIGTRFTPRTELDIAGREVTVPVTAGRYTLLMFISPACKSCSDMLPALKAIARQERDRLDMIFASFNGTRKENETYIVSNALDDIPYLLSPELAADLAVTFTPYGILMDGNGIVRTKGIVNNREHLDSLLNAGEGPFPSLDAFFRSQDAEENLAAAGSATAAEK